MPLSATRTPDADARGLAAAAVAALLAELATTPKPGLVDRENSGAHRDLCVGRLTASALALEDTFAALARCAAGRAPSLELREELGALGRAGERTMLRASGGSNTHRGALWALGVIVAATTSLRPAERTAARITANAARLARLPDRFAVRDATHGALAVRRFGARGAVAEAANGFPSVTRIALPLLRRAADPADVLLALLAVVDDTCLLHRGGLAGARFARMSARAVLRAGGVRTVTGLRALRDLDAAFIARGLSPGGCADLLAAGLLLDAVAS